MMSYSRLQTNVLAKFVDTTCLFRDVGAAVGKASSRRVRVMETYKKTKRTVTNYVCFCSSTMFTSKITTEIIENHSEFSGCSNSCNKFVSSRTWRTMKLPVILLWKRTSASVAPFWKGRGGNGPAMPPFSSVPVHTILHALSFLKAAMCHCSEHISGLLRQSNPQLQKYPATR